MNQVWHFMKLAVAVVAGVVAVVALGFFRDYMLANAAGIVSIAFSVMPE